MDSFSSGSFLFVLLPIVVGASYIFPTVVAAWRYHRNTNAIALTNVMLGWTVVGWVVALLWAMSANVKLLHEGEQGSGHRHEGLSRQFYC